MSRITNRAAGMVLVVLAAGSIVIGPPTWATIALAATATIALARDVRFGWLGAGLVVALALPYGRGADVVVLELAGLPVRPQDAAIGIALLGALVAIVRQPRRPRGVAVVGIVAFGMLLTVGIVALVIGVFEGHALRDLARDVRFWALYGTGIVAILLSPQPTSVLRALIFGTAACAIVIVIASILPPLEDGLRDQVLTYDRGTPRMQFGNSVFFLPVLAYAGWRFLGNASVRSGGLVALMVIAIILSLTRMSILAAFAAVTLVGVGSLWVHRGALGSRLRPALAAIGLVVASVAISMLIVTVSQVTAAGGAGENPLDRVLGQSEESDIDAIVGSRTGRISTYLSAYAITMEHLPSGAGLGQLVPIAYAHTEARAHVIGRQPGVDNAYLTVAVKAGIAGIIALSGVLLLPLLVILRHGLSRMRGWYIPGWLAILVLTMTQGFASSGYGPYGIALLIVLPVLRTATRQPGSTGDSAPDARRS